MKFIIVGAGISGLAAANRLGELAREAGEALDLRVLESSSRAGGVISTRVRDGFLWEEGPDCFLTEKPWAADLCRRLGLEGEMTGTNPDHSRCFVYGGGRLHTVPDGFTMLAPTRFGPLAVSSLFSWMGKLRMLMDLALPARREGGDESLGAFVRRRLGGECLERMAQPMVAGVYSGDVDTLSLEATFPRFLELERRYGSVIRGLLAARRGSPSKRPSHHGKGGGPRYGLFTALKPGLSSLVERLVEKLPAGVLRLDAPVDGIVHDGREWRVSCRGEVLTADAVCLAVPAPRAAVLLKKVDGSITSLLEGIRYRSATTVHLNYRRAAVGHPLNGFGFVVPSVAGFSFTGCTFASVKFPGRAPAESVLLRAFVAEDPSSSLRQDDVSLAQAVRWDVERVLGISEAPLWMEVKRHPSSLPHYAVGHLRGVASLEDRLRGMPGLALAGNAYRGIGLPDCVRSGESAADALWRRARSESAGRSLSRQEDPV